MTTNTDPIGIDEAAWAAAYENETRIPEAATEAWGRFTTALSVGVLATLGVAVVTIPLSIPTGLWVALWGSTALLATGVVLGYAFEAAIAYGPYARRAIRSEVRYRRMLARRTARRISVPTVALPSLASPVVEEDDDAPDTFAVALPPLTDDGDGGAEEASDEDVRAVLEPADT